MAKVRRLSPELAETARKELNEVPERVEADLMHLKQWISKQPHLRARTDDQFLLAFLRGSKFSLERAKEKLDAYYTLRAALPDFFSHRDPKSEEIQLIMKLGVFLPLGQDAEGRRVVLLRVGCYDPALVRLSDVFLVTMMVMDLLLLEDDALLVHGLVGVIDLADVTLGHAAQYSPVLIKRAMTYYQEGFPLRPKGLHHINMIPGVEQVLNLFRMVLKEKIRNRMSVHSGVKGLFDFVPKEILPKEYGGDAPPLQEIADEWISKLEASRQYFLDDALYGVDESARPGAPKTHADLFGVDGSFRQLAFD